MTASTAPSLVPDTATLVPNSVNGDYLPPEELNSLTTDRILSDLRGLSELIAAHSQEVERLGRPNDEVISSIRRTGLFYLYVPRKYGGLEYDGLDVFIEAISIIAENCASTAWCCSFPIIYNWQLGTFPAELQEDIWSKHPYVSSAASGFPPGKLTKVEGGYRLSGRWKFASNILHSQWVGPTVAMLDNEDGEPVAHYVWAPIEDVTVLDTWHVDGLAGSGSNDFEVNDAFVPAHRVLEMSKYLNGLTDNDSPTYRYPVQPFYVIGGAPALVGAARGAVDRYRERLTGGGSGFRDSTGTGRPVDNPRMHRALGEADMDVTAAELILRSAARDLERLGRGPSPMSVKDRVSVRTKCSQAVSLARQALRTLNDNGGTTAHNLSQQTQRALRDVTMLSTHVAFDTSEAMELHGRVLAGLPSTNPGFQ